MLVVINTGTLSRHSTCVWIVHQRNDVHKILLAIRFRSIGHALLMLLSSTFIRMMHYTTTAVNSCNARIKYMWRVRVMFIPLLLS